MNCRSCEDSKSCAECLSLIDGTALQRKLKVPREIVLETCDGVKCYGELFLVSPVGIGIKISNLIASPWYLIRIHDNFQLKVQEIGSRGKDNHHGFDILEVLRPGGSTSRLNNDEYRVLTMSADQLIDELTDTLPDTVKNIVQERLKNELEKAKIFDSVQVGQIIKYQKDNVKPLDGGIDKINIHHKGLNKIIQKCRITGLPQRELFVDRDRIYDVHGIPFDYQSGGLLLLDVTSLIKYERQLKEKERKIYQEAIEAVTGGRLLLIKRPELPSYTPNISPNLDVVVSAPEEIDNVRLNIEKMLKMIGIPEKEIFLFTVCVSEAITNALKYAGRGRCCFWLSPDKVSIKISDDGPGISFKDLPKATLMQHFSTTKSLGCGFTIMLRFLDKIIMATDSHGTTLVLEKLAYTGTEG